MAKGKPRHNPDKAQNQYGTSCPYDDGSYGKECGNPWAHLCDGNRHHCLKLKYQNFASQK